MAYQRRGAPPSFNHPPSRPAAARVRDALSAYSCKISFYSQTYLHPCLCFYRYCSTFFQKQITINKFWGTFALIMREWLIGQFRSHLPLKHLKVGRLFVMDYYENLSKLKVHCLHCTGAIRQFETNFG